MTEESGVEDVSEPVSEVFEYTIDDEDTLVEEILRAVGAATNTSFLPSPDEPLTVDGGRDQMQPLNDVIDVDALIDLSSNSAARANWQVTFPYAGCEVTVTDDDTIVVRK